MLRNTAYADILNVSVQCSVCDCRNMSDFYKSPTFNAWDSKA